MRLVTFIATLYLCVIGLQGCATTTPTEDNQLTRAPMIASPAERISAQSGALHTGMSGY